MAIPADLTPENYFALDYIDPLPRISPGRSVLGSDKELLHEGLERQFESILNRFENGFASSDERRTYLETHSLFVEGQKAVDVAIAYARQDELCFRSARFVAYLERLRFDNTEESRHELQEIYKAWLGRAPYRDREQILEDIRRNHGVMEEFLRPFVEPDSVSNSFERAVAVAAVQVFGTIDKERTVRYIVQGVLNPALCHFLQKVRHNPALLRGKAQDFATERDDAIRKWVTELDNSLDEPSRGLTLPSMMQALGVPGLAHQFVEFLGACLEKVEALAS